MNKTEKLKNKTSLLLKAFTFIELLVVLGIIAVIATFAISTFRGAGEKARDAERKSDLKNIQTALRIYYNTYNTYPANPAATDYRMSACGSACTNACPWNNAWSCGTTVYMASLPGDPKSGNPAYRYTQINSDNYTLQACLERTNDAQGITPTDLTWCGGGRVMFELRP